MLSALATACPDTPSESATEARGSTTDSSITEMEPTTTLPTTTGASEVPPEACFDPPAPPVPKPVVVFPDFNRDETFSVDPFANACPGAFVSFPELLPESKVPFSARLYRPAEDDGVSWPIGQFDLLVFSHGNKQDGVFYEGIFPREISDGLFPFLARHGFLVASIVGDGNTAEYTRGFRLTCLAEALLVTGVEWPGTSRLNERYALGGHSNGGLGAFVAAVRIGASNSLTALNAKPLVALSALAPKRIDPDAFPVHSELLLIGDVPDYVVLQGSGDGDTVAAAFTNYDRVLPALSPDGNVESAPAKALIWAYDVEHSEYGGRSEADCVASDKGIALAQAYLAGFLIESFYKSPIGQSVFFAPGSPVVLPQVSVPAFWSDFGGVAQVFGSSSQRVDTALGFRGRVLDGFENQDSALSDSFLTVSNDFASFAEHVLSQELEVDGFSLESTHSNGRAAIFQWTDQDKISWDLDLDTRVALASATSLTFRGGAFAAATLEAPMQCEIIAGEVPEIILIAEDDNETVSLPLAPYGRLALPDARSETPCDGVIEPTACPSWDVMQTTFRVPLSDLCGLSDTFVVAKMKKLTLRFDGPGERGAFFLDDLELHSVPGEPQVSCKC